MKCSLLAVGVHSYVTAKGDPTALSDLLLRLHSLLGVHAEGAGGQLCPSGIDLTVATLPSVETAIDVAFALQREVPDLLGVGISSGEVARLEDGRVLGPAVARSLRLAMLAGPANDVLLDERARIPDLPAGIGRFEGRRSVREVLGFGFDHLSDHRGAVLG